MRKTRIGKLFAAVVTTALVAQMAVVPAFAAESELADAVEEIADELGISDLSDLEDLDLSDLEALGDVDVSELAELGAAALGDIDLSELGDLDLEETDSPLGATTAQISVHGAIPAGDLGDLELDADVTAVVDPAAGAQSMTGTVTASGMSYEFSEYLDKDALLVKIPGLPKVLSFSFASDLTGSYLESILGSKNVSAIGNIMKLLSAEFTNPEAMQKYAAEIMGVVADVLTSVSFEEAPEKECTVGSGTVTCQGVQAAITKDIALEIAEKFLDVTMPNGQTMAEYIEMLTSLSDDESGAVSAKDAVEEALANMPEMTLAIYLNDSSFPVEIDLTAEDSTIALQFRGEAETPWTEIAFSVDGTDMAVVNVELTESGISATLTVQGSEIGTLNIDLSASTYELYITGLTSPITGTFGADGDGFVFTAKYEGLEVSVNVTSGGTVEKPEGDVLELTTMTEEDFASIAGGISSVLGSASLGEANAA